ncbi:restriction endonuclease subunit S [Streptomyces sp. NPDC048106]|uniref:restriction endonuclease subunit S n=1 Tax=Streptomyces sp. NPDC048106 TaxID=3155750 RepID=UPI003452C62E
MTRPSEVLPYGPTPPESWKVVPLKYLASLTNGYVFDSDRHTDSGTPIIRIENLNGSENFNHSALALDDRFRVLPGDLLFSWSGNPGTSFGPFRWHRPGVHYLNQHIFNVSVTGCDRNWLYWSLKAATHWIERELTSGMIGMVHVTKDDLGNVPVPVPPVEVQRRVARFLDAETARIDRLVELRTRTLGLLAERMTTRMDAAVRGAGTPGAKRPSEYPPLGDVPAGWRRGRLRSVECEVQTGPFGSQLHAEDYVDDGWPVVNPANITPAGLVADPQVTVSDEVRARLERHVLRAGDVVFGRRGELGRAGIVAQAQEGWVCGTGSLRVRFPKGSFDPGYLRRYLAIPAVRHYFQLHAIGSTMPNLNSGILLNMPLLLPSLAEQAAIVEECAEIERRAAEQRSLGERQIRLLLDRRRSVVTAAVTGRFDVSAADGRGVTEGVAG